jgi:hypothetical protein
MSRWPDLDSELLIDILDQALTSDDPRIQSALDRLLTITALINPKASGRPIGDLNRKVARLEQDFRELKHYMMVHTKLDKDRLAVDAPSPWPSID